MVSHFKLEVGKLLGSIYEQESQNSITITGKRLKYIIGRHATYQIIPFVDHVKHYAFKFGSTLGSSSSLKILMGSKAAHLYAFTTSLSKKDRRGTPNFTLSSVTTANLTSVPGNS
jgi:hypothetical protein